MPSEEEDRKKRKRWWDDDSFNIQFEAIQQMFEEIMKMFSETNPEELFGADAQDQFEEILKHLQKNPMVWGFSAALGPDGKMRLNPFGNLNPEGAPPVVREEREPMIDVMEQDNDIIILAELPGVKEDDLHVKVEDYSVTIQVATPDRKYAKDLDLPTAVDKNSVKTTYNNGILEIQLKKR
ncbi:MAG: archaeal heat shock protein Hsp20 [Candidatus Odinarchaeota archaeon]